MSLTRLKRTNELGHVFPTDNLILLTPVSSQEIDEMLSNQLTLDDEDAVQAELRQLQGEAAEPVSQIGLSGQSGFLTLLAAAPDGTYVTCQSSVCPNDRANCSSSLR